MTRFLTPYLAQFGGYALFMDCDMLCRGDVWELVKLAKADKAERGVWVVKHDYQPSTSTKHLGQSQTQYRRKNWSSLMLFKAKLCRLLTPDYINTATGMELHQFDWMPDAMIGSLPKAWNWLVGEYPQNPDAKLWHYTLGGPWFKETQFCDHHKEWFDEYKLMAPSFNLYAPKARHMEESHASV